MSITRGAKKAHRSSLQKQAANLRRKDRVARALKSLKKLTAAGNKKEAQSAMREFQSAIDKAVKNKILKKNTAARKKSRLSKLVKQIS
ncbi:MAG: 30S ribosomal protein S20 [bacterium]|nr:30S ribosomal protein S20 [bacterium]